MRALSIALSFAILGTSNALALDYYVGCGTVLAPVQCEGCSTAFPGGGCECHPVLTQCDQNTGVCTTSPPGYTNCAGGACYKVYKHEIPCYSRKACNNANGIEGGSCRVSSTCYQSDETVYGPNRWEYYTDVPC